MLFKDECNTILDECYRKSGFVSMKSVHNHESPLPAKACIYQALVLLMDTTPYEKISITDICARAGVSRMAYYRHYSSKHDILLQPLRRRLDELLRKVEAGTLRGPLAYWTEYFRCLRQDDLIPLVFRAGLSPQMDEFHADHVRQMYSSVEGWDFDKPWQRMHLHYGMGGAASLLRYSLTEAPEITNEELAAYMAEKMLPVPR